jgi:hypothetical protein
VCATAMFGAKKIHFRHSTSYFRPSPVPQRLPLCPGAQTPFIHVRSVGYCQLSCTHYHFVSPIPWTVSRLLAWVTSYILIVGSLSSVTRFSCPLQDKRCSCKCVYYITFPCTTVFLSFGVIPKFVHPMYGGRSISVAGNF